MRKFAIEIKWGILFSVATLVWMIIENSIGLHDVYIGKQARYTNLFGIVAVVIYVLALREKKYLFYKGVMSWNQGFLSGVVLSVVVSVLSPLVQYISYTFISPNFFRTIIQYYVEHKIQTQIQAENYFNLKSYILQGIFGALSMGTITAAIVSLFLRTKKETI